MHFSGVIDKIMPDVQNGSDEPLLIYRDNHGEWHGDYTQNQYGDVFDWVELMKELDPLALTVKGKDFSKGSYGFVFDNVLIDRLRNEYHLNRSSGRETDDLAALFCFFEDNIGAFSYTAVDYLTALERPLTALQEMCPHNMEATKDGETYNEALADDAINRIEAVVKERLHIQDTPELGGTEIPGKGMENPVITAVVTNGHNHQRGITISFPTTQEGIRAAMNVRSMDACRVYDISCDAIPALVHYLGNGTTLDELQYIAAKIAALTPDEREAFSAFLEVPYSTADITAEHVMDALENVSVYSLDASIKTEEAVGRTALNIHSKEIHQMLDKLAASGDGSFITDYIKTLESCIDAAAFGRSCLEQGEIHLTTKGLVEVEWNSFNWRDNREVPDEYRLTDRKKPSILQTLETHKASIAQQPPVERHRKGDPSL